MQPRGHRRHCPCGHLFPLSSPSLHCILCEEKYGDSGHSCWPQFLCFSPTCCFWCPQKRLCLSWSQAAPQHPAGLERSRWVSPGPENAKPICLSFCVMCWWFHEGVKMLKHGCGRLHRQGETGAGLVSTWRDQESPRCGPPCQC